jgi:N-dimethylarginine dimethylaminohydrolase
MKYALHISMLRLCIKPTTFSILPIQDNQNRYIDIYYKLNQIKLLRDHLRLEKSFISAISYEIENPEHSLSDIVFVANGGLCLPRLPKPIILLPNMKYKQRKEELPYLKGIFKDLEIKTIDFPGTEIFEGQAELKWFHGGKKAICGYGYRATKKAFEILNAFFKKLYGAHNLEPPELLSIPLKSADYYHLDVAMLEFDGSKCIVHKRAFSDESVRKIKTFLGPDTVHIIDTNDSFCLNAVVDGDRLITHMLKEPLKKQLEKITGKKIHMVDTSEFEKSGGSVRCMTLDIF